MALLERVTTLVRANLNDLIDKAEDPEKMIKQVILDMQNQLMQVKTQVAIAIAGQHMLMQKHKEMGQQISRKIHSRLANYRLFIVIKIFLFHFSGNVSTPLHTKFAQIG